MKEHLETICTAVPESEEYAKAEKTIKSKISNLENSVHITIDLERTTSKASALEYIKAEIVPAIDRLQAEYDAKYVIVDQEPDEEMSLALRKTFHLQVYSKRNQKLNKNVEFIELLFLNRKCLMIEVLFCLNQY